MVALGTCHIILGQKMHYERHAHFNFVIVRVRTFPVTLLIVGKFVVITLCYQQHAMSGYYLSNTHTEIGTHYYV